MLTSDTLVYYLIEQQLLPLEAILDGDVTISTTRSRNQSYRVECQPPQHSFFVKQALLANGQAFTMQREATWYRMVNEATAAPFAALRDVVPAYYGYDPDDNILVLGLVSDGVSVRDYHRYHRAFPVEIGRQLALGLAACHAIGGSTFPHDSATLLQPSLPWILTLMAHQSVGAEGASPAQEELLTILHAEAELQQLLVALRQQWRSTALTHGDLKWDNCIVPLHRSTETPLVVTLVDWETSAPGDPAWDVGSIFHAYLSEWVWSMPDAVEMQPHTMMARAATPIEWMHPGLHAFWNTYWQARSFDQATVTDELERALRYAGARLFQTAYESLHGAAYLTPHSLTLLQLGENLMLDPADAAVELLALV